MALTVFVDEAGGVDTGHLSMSGLFAHAENWAKFNTDWQRVLDGHPRITRLKMAEAMRKSGDFGKFTYTERNEKIKDFLKVINSYVLGEMIFTTNVDAIQKTWGKENPRPMDDPYFWGVYSIIYGVCDTAWQIGYRNRIEFLFDEKGRLGRYVRRLYPLASVFMTHIKPEFRALLPVDIAFTTDDSSLPIQAADLLSTWRRKEADTPNDKRFNWIHRIVQIPVTRDMNLSMDRLRETLEEVEAAVQWDPSNEQKAEILNAIREVFGGKQ